MHSILPSLLRGDPKASNSPRIFDQNESCSESYLNPKYILSKRATLKRWRLTVKKHNKTVKNAVFCILWRPTVSKRNAAQHWVLAHSKECHFYYTNRQRTFHCCLFENLQDFFFKRLKNTSKSRGKSQKIVSFLGIFKTCKGKIL